MPGRAAGSPFPRPGMMLLRRRLSGERPRCQAPVRATTRLLASSPQPARDKAPAEHRWHTAHPVSRQEAVPHDPFDPAARGPLPPALRHRSACPAGADGRCLPGGPVRGRGQCRRHGRDGRGAVHAGTDRAVDGRLPPAVGWAGPGQRLGARPGASARCRGRSGDPRLPRALGAAGAGQRRRCRSGRFRCAVRCLDGGAAGGGIDHHGRALHSAGRAA
jgi:hypothetical protein